MYVVEFVTFFYLNFLFLLLTKLSKNKVVCKSIENEKCIDTP